MISQKQIAVTSARYRVLLMALFCLVPVGNAFLWGFIEYFPQLLHNAALVMGSGFTPLMKVLAFLVSMIKGGIVMYALWVLVTLFKLYETGIFFNKKNVDCFKQLSRTLIWWVIASVVTTPLMTLVLTMNNPPGSHMISLELQSADITALITGGILRIIAGVMADGQRLQEEQDLTI